MVAIGHMLQTLSPFYVNTLVAKCGKPGLTFGLVTTFMWQLSVIAVVQVSEARKMEKHAGCWTCFVIQAPALIMFKDIWDEVNLMTGTIDNEALF